MNVDMSEARDMCLRLVVLLDELDEAEPNVLRNSKEKAVISGELLYAAHCADLVRAEITSQYHVFKGRVNVPLVSAA